MAASESVLHALHILQPNVNGMTGTVRLHRDLAALHLLILFCLAFTGERESADWSLGAGERAEQHKDKGDYTTAEGPRR